MASTFWQSSLSGPPGDSMAIMAAGFSPSTIDSVALSSAYVYGSTGNSFAWMFMSPDNANLTDIYVYVSVVTGTGATGGNINYEIRSGLNGGNKPGSTLVSSGTIAISNTTGWKTISGLSVSLTAGVFYSILIADANGNATNSVTLYASPNGGVQNNTKFCTAVTSTNGFSTGTATNRVPYGAWKIGNVWYGGACFDTIATVSSGTYERGVRFQVPTPMTLIGVYEPQQDIGLSNAGQVISLYADATATLGTALTSYTFPTYTVSGSSPTPIRVDFPPANWYDVLPNTWYRFVYKPASSTTIPRKNTGAATIPTNVRSACFPFGGNCYWTDASSGSFVDDTNSLCLMGPVLVPSGSVAPGSNTSIVGGHTYLIDC